MFSKFFIERPIFSCVISIIIVLAGLAAMRSLPVEQYPQITPPVVSVTAFYPGATPEAISQTVAAPLEQQINGVEHMVYMQSGSASNGQMNLNVYFEIGTDPDQATINVNNRVSAAMAQLPEEVKKQGVTVKKKSTSILQVITLVSPNQSFDTTYLSNYALLNIIDELKRIPGVGDTMLFGGTDYAMRIWLRPDRLAQLQLTPSDVIGAIREQNTQFAAGKIGAQPTSTPIDFTYTVQTKGRLEDVKEFENIIIRSMPNGAKIRVKDIARVELGGKDYDIVARANGKPAIGIATYLQPGANSVAVADAVHATMAQLQTRFPQDIEYQIPYDTTEFVKLSIEEVVHTLFEAMVLVFVVVYLFLQNFRATLIPCIAVPVSLIGTFAGMLLLGFSINLLTLFGMVLTIGIVVDDAIVVLENVDRHIKQGEEPFRAAIIGTREIAVPVIAMTVTLAAVYAPIALMGGITGSLFKEFALTLAGAVFVSGIIALTLSPMMCAKMLKANEKPGKFESTVHHLLERMTDRYDGMLHAVMQKRIVVLVFAVIVFGSLPLLFKFIPSELAPSEDKGVMAVLGTAPSNANLDYIENTMADVNKILDEQPEIAYSQVFSGVFNANQAFGIASMVPWSQREASQKEVLDRVANLVKDIPGMAITTFQFPELPGASSGLPIQFVITTPKSFESLFLIAGEMLAATQANGQFVYSDLDLNYDSATMKIKIDKDKAGAYGITMQDIGITMGTMMADGYVNRIDLDGRSYEVIPQVERKYRMNPESIKGYYVRAADGKSIPLGSLISIEVVGEPRALPHFNQLNSATIGAVPAPGVAMGDAINWFKATAEEKLPQGYRYDFMGEARQFVTEGNALYATFALALAIIFLVLAIQFESVRDPLVIMVSVPLAISGALIALAWGMATMNIYSQVGLITLVGLITKHGILICEVAKEEQLLHGMNRMEAVMQAAKVRLRPILMTTAAMIAGLIPLLYAAGAGAAQRFSIGIVIVAGLAIGTIFTLFVLPVIYTYLASEHKPLPVFDESIPPKAKGSH